MNTPSEPSTASTRGPAPHRRISVALLVGDSAAVLRPMLGSLVAQTRLADEVVIHDGASTDDTMSIIRSFDGLLPLTVVRSPTRRSVGASRALAIEAATGELIAIADHDDAFLPDHFAVLEQHLSGPGTVVTPTALLWTPSKRVVPMSDHWNIALPSPSDQLSALAASNVITGMAMYTRSDYERFGPYRDESFVEDWDLWIRMALGGVRFVRPSVPTLLYRWGHANVSSDRPAVQAADAALIARHEAALRAALGDAAYARALAHRSHRAAWSETVGLLRAGDGRTARRTARHAWRSGDKRLLAAAVLPTPILRRILHVDSSHD